MKVFFFNSFSRISDFTGGKRYGKAKFYINNLSKPKKAVVSFNVLHKTSTFKKSCLVLMSNWTTFYLLLPPIGLLRSWWTFFSFRKNFTHHVEHISVIKCPSKILDSCLKRASIPEMVRNCPFYPPCRLVIKRMHN